MTGRQGSGPRVIAEHSGPCVYERKFRPCSLPRVEPGGTGRPRGAPSAPGTTSDHRPRRYQSLSGHAGSPTREHPAGSWTIEWHPQPRARMAATAATTSAGQPGPWGLADRAVPALRGLPYAACPTRVERRHPDDQRAQARAFGSESPPRTRPPGVLEARTNKAQQTFCRQNRNQRHTQRRGRQRRRAKSRAGWTLVPRIPPPDAQPAYPQRATNPVRACSSAGTPAPTAWISRAAGSGLRATDQ